MRQHGLHHVTAIAGNARRNLDFYTDTLGMRLVKKTVNFDDPGTYHLYYGDETGQPGTILTFFPWAHVAPGRSGIGQTSETAFQVPAELIGYWMHRFVEKSVPHANPEKRFGETVLAFKDPDGMALALVGVPAPGADVPWAHGDIPAEHSLRGFHGVTLMLEDGARTGAILTDVLGFGETGREDTVTRFVVPGFGPGRIVDIRSVGGFLPGRMGGGSVHHVAFRAADDVAQSDMARRLEENHGIVATEQRDRNYFRSIYFREPGGILFEIATDDPGFAADEAVDSLGSALKLPAFLEPRRREIEDVLPELA